MGSKYPLVDTPRKLKADFDITKQVLGRGRLDILDKAGVACGEAKGFKPIGSPEDKRFECELEGIHVDFRYLATEESESEFTVKWLVNAKLGLWSVRAVEVDHIVMKMASGDMILRGIARVDANPVIETVIKKLRARIDRAVQTTMDWFCKALEEVSKNPQNYLGSMVTRPDITVLGADHQPLSVTNITLTPAAKAPLYNFALVLQRSEATATIDVVVNQFTADVRLEPQTWQVLLQDLHLHTYSDPGVRSLHDAQIHPHALSRLEKVGKDMFLLLPKTVREELKQGSGHLRVTATPELFHLPWELLNDGEHFLGTRYAIGRLILGKGAKKTKPRVQRDRVKLLFIADPTSNLPEALTEVKLIESALKSGRTRSKIDITVWEQSEATKMRFLSALDTGVFDVVHFAGHGHFDAHKPENSYLMFPKEFGEGWIPCYRSEIAQSLGENPPVIFFAKRVLLCT